MKRLKIYEGFGVELEYMIVDKNTLKAQPISDKLLYDVTGGYNSDFENGKIAWSNELVLHVIEIKTNGPREKLFGLESDFYDNILDISEKLENYNCKLLPTGAHPFFEPKNETRLWSHENNPVYEAYNRIFNCEGHGWSNLQSTHINLPFSNDEEFFRLHTAIRALLPVIPGLTASTPVLDSKYTGITDTRLEYYKNNQKLIPSIAGDVIPELIKSKDEYYSKIFNKIFEDITPYDTDNILKHEWLNSRGAIARFDRGSIEIRIIDLQESALADVALASLIIESVHHISENKALLDIATQLPRETLVNIFNATILSGENNVVTDQVFLSLFGLDTVSTISDIWKQIADNVSQSPKFISATQLNKAKAIIASGTLSSRILRALDNDFSHQNILDIYNDLSVCLTQNKLFTP